MSLFRWQRTNLVLSESLKLGSGARFKKLKSTLALKGAFNPGALASFIGRKKFGKAKFQTLAKLGKKHKKHG